MHVVIQAMYFIYLGLVKAQVRYRRHRHIFKGNNCSKAKTLFSFAKHEIYNFLALDSLIDNYLISMQI